MADEVMATEDGLDENTRRYYLDAMGIQCWQLLDTEAATETDVENNKDVQSAESVGTELTWPRLEADIKQCDRCALSQSRNQAIVGRGNKNADLMFVLLSPDASDDQSSIICSGDNGDLLTKMLSAINVSINDVYITSLLKCAPPATHTVSPAEIQQCNAHLKQQVQLVQPKRLVILGATATQCLLNQNTPLDDIRQQCNQISDIQKNADYQYESIPFLVSYSPEELIKSPENKRKAWADLQMLEQLI